MKEIFLISVGIILLVICCILTATGDSFIFLDVTGSTWAALAGIGALASFGYFFFGK
jgi:drug/metabolite transporter (DMT)-like permease